MTTSLNVIMTDRVVTVKPQTTLRELVGILRDENVSGAPVVSGDRVIGVVSATDLLDFEVDAPYEGPEPGWEAPREDETPTSYFTSWEGSIDVLERFHRLEEPEWDRLMEHTVAEVMTPAIWALSPDEECDRRPNTCCAAGSIGCSSCKTTSC